MRTVPQRESPDWWCDHCKRPQYQLRRIYTVSLCYLCIAGRADQPGMAHYAECRLFQMEKENMRLKRLVTRLLGRTEGADGPCEPLGEYREAKRSAIAFAALITAYGKPIHIEKSLVDALPDHFELVSEDTKTGRIYWVEPDLNAPKDLKDGQDAE
jgi:hypothetical protein